MPQRLLDVLGWEIICMLGERFQQLAAACQLSERMPVVVVLLLLLLLLPLLLPLLLASWLLLLLLVHDGGGGLGHSCDRGHGLRRWWRWRRRAKAEEEALGTPKACSEAGILGARLY